MCVCVCVRACVNNSLGQPLGPAKYDHGLCARLKQSVCACVRACMR